MLRVRPVVRYSKPSGIPITFWEPLMARTPDELADCIVYLYPTVDEAQRGATREEPGFGGTGFLVTVPVEGADPPQGMLYVVTNSHVVGPEGQSCVIRLNTQAGGTEIIETDPDAWVHHGDGDDVAALPVGGLQPAHFRYQSLGWETWPVTAEFIDEQRVGPGDEVVYLGRFRMQEGQRRNLPTTRSGIIARMPLDEGVEHPRGFDQESFIIESHSISGYSGSPVFLYIPPFSWRGQLVADQSIASNWHIKLIGIDWGHFPDLTRVLGKDRKTPSQEERWVKQNSGLMMVVPSWRIDQLLRDDDRLKQQRQAAYSALRQRQSSATVVLDAEPSN
jgi:hypothetical protein